MALHLDTAQRSDGWYVVDEEGQVVDGPFANRDLAGKRLLECIARQASTVGSGLHSPAPLGGKHVFVYTRPFKFTVPVGVWDQLAKFGEFEKDGHVTFSEETLRQGLKNFASRKNKLSMDYEHQALNAPLNGQPAPPLAYYDAMALVIGGKVVDFAARDASVQPPKPADCVNPDTGAVEDGLYIRRAKVTPLGEQLLPNYDYISPAFTTEGTDEQGYEIGLDFINLAATGTPFLDGMKPIEMTRFGAQKAPMSAEDKTMNLSDAILKRYRLAKSFSDADLSDAMKRMADDVDAAYKRRMDDLDAAYKKLRKAFAEVDASDDDKQQMDDVDGAYQRMRKAFDDGGDATACGKAMDDLDGAMKKFGDDGAGSDAMKKMAKDLGCAPSLSAIAEKVTAMRFTHAPKEEVAQLKTKLAALEQREAERDQVAKDAEVRAFAKQAIDEGAWDPEDLAGLVEFRKSAPDAAKKHVEKNRGLFTAMKRFTKDGKPFGKPDETHAFTVDEESDGIGAELVTEARKLMAGDPKLTMMSAIKKVHETRPELYRGANAGARK
jgi:phage I-like protein